ncbi:hypothetical protein MHU86_11580 [Fragilaria crotonensis]|nr:hypothetical protein MHU86_11580 [Fragilaria crotonensis]
MKELEFMPLISAEADKVLKTLFYGGEKAPICGGPSSTTHWAFNAYVKREGRIVHSDSMKIRMLVDKIKADFLTPTKAQLEIELSRIPTTITYEQSLSLFRNMVNQKHPPQMGTVQNRARRQINKVSSGGRGSRGRAGFGRGGRGGRQGGRGRGGRQTRTDSRMITLTDGTQIEYHASFNFPRHTYLKMKQEDKDTLKRERAAYNQRNGRGNREIQELRSQIQELQQNSGATNAAPPTDTVLVRSQVSQITANNSIMGGRNEQASNRDTRRAAAVFTKRHVRSTERSSSDPLPNTAAENECDTNADTCCLGKNFVVLAPTFRTADVYAYDTSIKPIENVPIVSGATAYDRTNATVSGIRYYAVNASMCVTIR